jgi:fumarate reductase flavoprotein subunit
MMAGLFERHGGVGFAIFDEPARAAAAPNPLNRAYWVADILEAKADEGRIVRAQSLDQLARSAGIDGAALAGTIERYNADCDRGVDDAFFKNPVAGMRRIATPPFYAVEVRPAIIAWTGAGLRIDAHAHVMACDERPIPGLFAAGETVGSLHGDRYVGGGGSFGPCLVFGKLAGENAATASLG